jgi:hypothetical protein
MIRSLSLRMRWATTSNCASTPPAALAARVRAPAVDVARLPALELARLPVLAVARADVAPRFEALDPDAERFDAEDELAVPRLAVLLVPDLARLVRALPPDDRDEVLLGCGIFPPRLDRVTDD